MLARIAMLLQPLPTSSSSQAPASAQVPQTSLHQNVILQQLLATQSMPTPSQVMLDYARQQADMAYRNVAGTGHTADQ